MNMPNPAQTMPTGRQGGNLPTLPIYYIYGQGRAWFTIYPGGADQIDSFAQGINEAASLERQRNLLVSKSGRLAWVSHVISEPERNQLSAPHRRMACGIGARCASSQKLHRRKSSTKRTRFYCLFDMEAMA